MMVGLRVNEELNAAYAKAQSTVGGITSPNRFHALSNIDGDSSANGEEITRTTMMVEHTRFTELIAHKKMLKPLGWLDHCNLKHCMSSHIWLMWNPKFAKIKF